MYYLPMLPCQKHHFSLPEQVHYLNCATMSPLSKRVEEAGVEGLRRKSQPYGIGQDHFFDTAETVKQRFAQLINCPDPSRIAIMPSVSYGMATVVKNLLKKSVVQPNKKIIVVGEEFPSGVYAWDELVSDHNVRLEIVSAPTELQDRGQLWNQKVLAAIDQNTLVVCVSPTHWADGTLFDLVAIRQLCTAHGVLLVVDGTQHVGAHGFDVQQVQPDFMVCGVYKWLLGPYSNAIAYCGHFFDDGFALEQTWAGRVGSQNFKNLVNYQSEMRPMAFRYNMGEFGNFINLPMIVAALDHLLEWRPEGIQDYAQQLSHPMVQSLRQAGYWIEADQHRAHHLFGIRPPKGIDLPLLQQKLIDQNVFVSYRGDAIRLSINVWNDAEDIAVFERILVNA